ncbi:hypothetical protein [Amycolatopsis sp. cmx-4-83]|uniref:hypothetical protein n=1 Tax=Amycolatopsis sp. cmx-4-83 TaxID=2790940 RepID=UPI003978E753
MTHEAGMAFLLLVSCRMMDWRGSWWSSVEVRARNATRTSSLSNAFGIPSGDTA